MAFSDSLPKPRLRVNRALEIEPENSRFHVNLGGVRLDQGQYALAETSFRRALELDPDYFYALSNILFLHTLDGRHGDRQCLEDARHFGRLVSAQASGRFSQWQCEVEPERLRVGVVSGDIRDHSVGLFLEGFLKEIDPARVELIAYPTPPGSERSDDAGETLLCQMEFPGQLARRRSRQAHSR